MNQGLILQVCYRNKLTTSELFYALLSMLQAFCLVEKFDYFWLKLSQSDFPVKSKPSRRASNSPSPLPSWSSSLSL